MDERIAYVNGEFLPESKATISILDRGFKWGDAVYDVECTFGGKIFKLEQHIDRLYRSLRYTRIDPGMPKEEMMRITEEVVEANRRFLGPDDDYTVSQIVSRGVLRPFRGELTRATVVVYCQPLGFGEFAKFYVEGAHVVTPSVRRTPPQCVSPNAKISNKMNHMLADFEAKLVDPEAFSLMLDLDGRIAENAGGNFVFVSQGTLMVPDRSFTLPGITLETVLELAADLGIPVVEGRFTPFEVAQADEALLCTSTYIILPVARVNGLRIGQQVPGHVTARLTAAFSNLVGVDIVQRALSHLRPEERRPLVAGG